MRIREIKNKIKENSDDMFANRAGVKVFLSTDGRGLWSNQAKDVPIIDLQLSVNDPDKEYGELLVMFNDNYWDVNTDGLIYTDELFMKQLEEYLSKQGLAGADVDYSEQGMQGDNYVSCDVGEDFIASWEAKFGQIDVLDEEDDLFSDKPRTPPKNIGQLFTWAQVDPTNRKDFLIVAKFGIRNQLTLKKTLETLQYFDDADETDLEHFGINDDTAWKLFNAYENIYYAWNNDTTGETSATDSWDQLDEEDDLFAERKSQIIARALKQVIDVDLEDNEEFQEYASSPLPRDVRMVRNVHIAFKLALDHFKQGKVIAGCGALEALVNDGDWDEWAIDLINDATGIDLFDVVDHGDEAQESEFYMAKQQVLTAQKAATQVNEAEVAEPPEPPRKTTTKTKTKPDIKFDPFQTKPDQPLANPPEEPQSRQRPQGPTIRKASQTDTQRAAAGVRLPPEAMRHLNNLGNIDIDPNLADYPARPEEPEFLPSTQVNTENLPAVAGQALAAEGIASPEFHQVASLPGNMSRMIRQLGKLLFGSMTTTATEDIYMIGNLGGQGPNTRMDVNSVANFVREQGEDLGPGDIDFDQIMPGYSAETHQYVAAGIR